MQVHSADKSAPDSASRQAARGAQVTADTIDQADSAVVISTRDPRVLTRGAVQRLQSTVGNQAVLRLCGQLPRTTIQRQLAGTEWYTFVGYNPRHPTLAPWAANLGSDWAHATNILNLGIHVAAESQDVLAQLIAAGGGGKGPYTQLTTLATAALQRGTNADLTALLNAAKSSLADVSALVNALPAGGTLTEATDLLTRVKTVKGSIRDATGILTVLPASATVPQAVDLLKVVLAANGNIPQTTAFLQALPRTASLNDAVDLLKDVGGIKGTVVQATTFANAVATRGTLADARKLLATAKPANRSIDLLTLLVNTSPAKSSLVDLADFLAAAQNGKGDLQQMSGLLGEVGRASFTLKQVSGLLPAVQAIGGTLGELKTLIGSLPRPLTGDDVDTLLGVAKQAQGTVGQLSNLAKAAPKGTTVTQLSDFVGAFHAAGGTVKDGATFVQTVGTSASFAEQLALFTGQSPLPAADALSFLSLQLKLPTIKSLATSLQGVAHKDALELAAAMRADGLSEADLVSLLDRLTLEGKQGPQIVATVRGMRGTMATKEASNLTAISPQGTRILSGPQIHSLVKGLQQPGKGAPGYEHRYPTGIPFDTFDVDTLFTHLDRNAIPALNGGKGKTAETVEQIAARRALALAQLKQKADVHWVDAVFNLYEHSGKVFPLTALRDVIKPLCPALTAVQVTGMVGWLDGLTGDEVLELLKALNDGLTPAQIRELLTTLHAAPVSYNGPQIRDLIKNLRGNLAVAGAAPKQLRSILTPLTQNQNSTRNPDSAGERLLTSSQLHAHLTTRIGAIQGGHAVPNLGNLHPTGQDYTTRTRDELWLDCGPGAIHQDVRTNQPETAQQIEMRRKLALNYLKTRAGYSAKLVQAVFDHDSGQTPRPFHSAVIEDGYGLGGHTVSSHVLDPSGTFKNRTDVAKRVCTKQPPCPERAGAFDSLVEANTAIGKVTTEMQGAWTGNNGYRHKICSGILGPIDIPNTTGVLIEKRDEPKLNPYSTNDMKKRGLLPGPTISNSLVIFVTPVNIRVSVEAYSGAPGGWHVVTAFPTL
jgi:hypothetical protein